MPTPVDTPSAPHAAEVAAVRGFNRFHTRWVGALNEHLLASGLALPQARVLYELAQAPRQQAVAAADLARALQLDAGYLSRLITGLENEGLLQRSPAPSHGKRQVLALTPAGRSRFEGLDSASASEVGRQLARLGAGERRELLMAMERVRRLLGDESAPAPAIVLRDPRPGDLGLVVSEQARIYAEEYGFDWTFEALVSEIASHFIRDFQPARERCWIAERGGRVVGSVFVVRQDDNTAKLRMLYVHADARGLGLGRQLVDECVRFAQAAGYRRMVLWTNAVLVSARRIYQAAGFERVSSEAHHSFGHDMVGEEWVLNW